MDTLWSIIFTLAGAYWACYLAGNGSFWWGMVVVLATCIYANYCGYTGGFKDGEDGNYVN